MDIVGFLSLEDPSLEVPGQILRKLRCVSFIMAHPVPGNVGLKDQQLALKWVQGNIASFNGDPNNVTIFGISAEGASVHYQMLSESSRGLFHKAICQSGSALSTWAWGSQTTSAIELAKILDGNVNNEKDALKVLTQVDSEKLFNTSQQIKDSLFASRRRRPFSPVIEKPNPTAFLTKSPVEIMKFGEYNHVPLIIGCVSNEGFLTETNIGFSFEFSRDDCVPWFFDLPPGSPQYNELKNKVEDFYFKDGETDEAKHALYSDVLVVNGIIECMKLHRRNAEYPIYFYNFDAATSIAKTFVELMCNVKLKKNYKGACHLNDSLYTFQRDMLVPDDEDTTVVRNIIQLWTSFAKTGTPKYDKIKWEPVYDVNDLKALNIDTEPTMVDNPYMERTRFWGKCFEKYPLKFD